MPIPSPCASNHSKSPTDHMFTSTAYTPSTALCSYTQNVHVLGIHEHMMQSLRDIFACQKDGEDQSNILASFVKYSQKKHKDGDFTDQEIYSAPERSVYFSLIKITDYAASQICHHRQRSKCAGGERKPTQSNPI